MLGVSSIIAPTILLIVALPASCACAYLFILTCLSGTFASPSKSSRKLFFDVIVPAHNEASGVAHTITNLLALDWPIDRFRVVVIADNCTDATASIARNAGATVLERHDIALRGKGYALAHAFSWSRAQRVADAVAVVDADSQVSANLLEAFATRIERGGCAVQAHYGVLNASASWRTRLMAIALGAIHKLRSRARERLRLSCGIRGNGWCVTHALLEQIPYKAFSLTEDVEFGVDLGMAGFRVEYSDEADVNGEMVTTESAARSQRQRWEGGRLKLVRDKVPKLLWAALTRASLVCLDLALDLLVLPLSYVVLNVAALILLSLGLGGWHSIFLWVGLVDAVALVLYVCRGWMLSGVGMRGLLDLARVPVYLVWKVLLLFSRTKPTTWIRTKREGS